MGADAGQPTDLQKHGQPVEEHTRETRTKDPNGRRSESAAAHRQAAFWRFGHKRKHAQKTVVRVLVFARVSSLNSIQPCASTPSPSPSSSLSWWQPLSQVRVSTLPFRLAWR